MSRVLVIADSQNPFVHPDYLAFLLAVAKQYKTDTTVHVGDEVDHHALSDYDHDPDGLSPGHELTEAIESLKPFYKSFPDTKVCESNHASRIFTKAYKCGIPKAYLKDYREFLQAPDGWKWAVKWEIDGVIYKHGVGYSGTMGALNSAKDEMKPCVIGHLHSDAGILFWSNGSEVLWGMNVGCGIDEKAYAFAYSKNTRKKSILACGVVIDGKPILIQMKTKNGRWTREL